MGKARLCRSGACTCGALQGYMGCSSTFQRNTWAHEVFAGCTGDICCEETVLEMFVQSYTFFFGQAFTRCHLRVSGSSEFLVMSP